MLLLLRLPAAFDRKVLELRREGGFSPVTTMDDNMRQVIEDPSQDNADDHFVLLRLLPGYKHEVKLLNILCDKYPDRWGRWSKRGAALAKAGLVSAHSTGSSCAELSCCRM
jgi:hypothetical protein